MSEPTLLPCPFCGGKPDTGRGHGTEHYVFCSECGAQPAGDDSTERAAETWNTRAGVRGAPEVTDADVERALKTLTGPYFDGPLVTDYAARIRKALTDFASRSTPSERASKGGADA